MNKENMKQLAVKTFLFSTIYFFFFLFSMLIPIPSLLGLDEIRSCLIGIISLLFIDNMFPCYHRDIDNKKG